LSFAAEDAIERDPDGREQRAPGVESAHDTDDAERAPGSSKVEGALLPIPAPGDRWSPDAARRHRLRQDVHDGERDRALPAADAGARAQPTLAAQLCSEFKEFFPENAVEYFVSYYDYYQPEAYIPRTDTYIAKDADINDEIDKLRHAATRRCSSGAT
jgi:hypothetical protein